eukprot:TRINITY_DN2347_c0_g1_i2.p1 TRINITY_DN2347_c0_g1~~TRINITY_DN2347_c0_g1_i2.p1  ORF type:complete len:462 (-),score=102.80 TRINITY_DN2347_c0_g1_i2:3599-4984(-)
MRVLSLEVHNVQRVSDVRFDLDGENLFVVGGKNGDGKSSAILGLLMALSGRSGMDDYPEIALRNGENEGWVKVHLSGESETTHQPGGMFVDLRLIRNARKGVVIEEFKIMDTDGDTAPEPRALLKQLFEMRAFDPLAFQKMKPKARKELLEKLLDLDFSEDRIEYQKLFDRRTDAKRDLAKAKAQLDGMPTYPDVKEISAQDLLAESDRRRSVNEASESQRKMFTTLTQSEFDSSVKASEIKSEIQELETKLQSLRIRLSNTEKEHEAIGVKIAAQKLVVAGLVDEDLVEISNQIRDVDKNNEKARANAKRKDVFDKWQELDKKVDALTESLDAIKDRNQKKLEDAEFPVEGMTLDSEGILLNGLPFEQASTAQQIIASVKVGIALNPKLRLMVSREGGALDDESIAALDAILEEYDFQMIIEMPTRSKTDEDLCSVIVKDGKVAKTNPRKQIPVMDAATA